MLYLKEANLQDAKAEYTFVREIPADENGFTNKWHGCDWDTFMEKALPEMLDYARGKNLPGGVWYRNPGGEPVVRIKVRGKVYDQGCFNGY